MKLTLSIKLTPFCQIKKYFKKSDMWKGIKVTSLFLFFHGFLILNCCWMLDFGVCRAINIQINLRWNVSCKLQFVVMWLEVILFEHGYASFGMWEDFMCQFSHVIFSLKLFIFLIYCQIMLCFNTKWWGVGIYFGIPTVNFKSRK